MIKRKTRRITFRLTETDYLKLKKMSNSVSEFVRDCIRKVLREIKKERMNNGK